MNMTPTPPGNSTAVHEQHSFEHLTSKKTLITSFVVNGANKIIPMVLGLITVPYFIQALGNEMFGILTIIWAFIGYGMMMDFGLGLALTRHIAGAITLNATQSLPTTIYSTTLVGFALGILGTLLFWFLSPFLVQWLSLSPQFQTDAIHSFRTMGIIIPFMVANLILIGVLEAYQRYSTINLLLWPIYISNFVLPILALRFYPSLLTVILCVLVGRILSFWLSIRKVQDLYDHTYPTPTYQLSTVKPLFGYGKWLSINNVIGTVTNSLDKSIISNVLGAANVAYFTTPTYALSRLSSFVCTSLRVLFPVFKMKQTRDQHSALRMYETTFGVSAIALLLIYGSVAILAKPLLFNWLDPDFATKAYPVTLLLCVAFCLTNLLEFSTSYMQSTGMAKANAVITAITFPLFILMIYAGIHWKALLGAATAIAAFRAIELAIRAIYIKRFSRNNEQEITSAPNSDTTVQMK